MNWLIHPYRLFILLSTSVVVIFFTKIDKMGFYSHYFKEIAEIELRNSQAVSNGDQLDVFSPDLRVRANRLSQLFWSILAPQQYVLTLQLPAYAGADVFVPNLRSAAYKLSFPIRAP